MPLLIAIHGFTGWGKDFSNIKSHLRLPIKVACMDLYCCEKNNLLDFYIAQIENLRKIHKQKKIYLLGYSMGGRIALHYANRYGCRINKLFLIGSNPGIEKYSLRKKRAISDYHLAQFLNRRGALYFLQYWKNLPLLRSQPFKLPSREICTKLWQRQLIELSPGILPNLWPKLPKLTVETHTFYGDRDKKYADISKKIEKIMPQAEMHPVKGCGHSPHIERPDSFYKQLREILLA